MVLNRCRDIVIYMHQKAPDDDDELRKMQYLDRVGLEHASLKTCAETKLQEWEGTRRVSYLIWECGCKSARRGQVHT